eukprot:3602115-Pyramimonas_sp.AAC.1
MPVDDPVTSEGGQGSNSGKRGGDGVNSAEGARIFAMHMQDGETQTGCHEEEQLKWGWVSEGA